MNELTRLEYTTASLILAQVIDIMEQHHEPQDVEAAIQAVFVRALELTAQRPIKPIEELFL